jgi:hypothetical protein
MSSKRDIEKLNNYRFVSEAVNIRSQLVERRGRLRVNGLQWSLVDARGL